MLTNFNHLTSILTPKTPPQTITRSVFWLKTYAKTAHELSQVDYCLRVTSTLSSNRALPSHAAAKITKSAVFAVAGASDCARTST